jgi:DNA processing protein
MTDATIVVETASKGGSMITAELVPQLQQRCICNTGKIYDGKSSGCLKLIQQNKAILLSSTEQLIEEMGWQEKRNNLKSKENCL